MSNQEIIAPEAPLPVEADDGRVVGLKPRLMMRGGGTNEGSVAIEQERAIAEARGQLQLAKMFPRSMAQCTSEFLDACKSLDFAKEAFYSVPNRGSGPSIRFAEEAARCYGNFDYGHRELYRDEGKSEVEVYAWDKERNNFSRRQITVYHIRDTKNGPRPLTDQTDIDNRIANVASKQMRGRILALLPKAMVAAGEAEAKRTLAGGGKDKPMSERINAMVQVFQTNFGVTTKHLEAYLGHAVDLVTVDELADLSGIRTALKDGAKASDYFKMDGESKAGGVNKALADEGGAKDDGNAQGGGKAAAEKPTVQKQPATPAAQKKPAAAKPQPEPEQKAQTSAPAEAPKAAETAEEEELF